MNKVKLNQFNNNWYKSGSTAKKTLWYFTNMFFFKTMLPFPSSFKIKLLKLFGAKMGQDIVIKPNVNIKYPLVPGDRRSCLDRRRALDRQSCNSKNRQQNEPIVNTPAEA